MPLKKLKIKATYYVMLESMLYKKYASLILLKCLRPKEVLLVMTEIHEGIYRAYWSGLKIR